MMISFFSGLTFGAAITTNVYFINDQGVGSKQGTVTFTDSPNGLIVRPDLKRLSPGFHGFHIHQNPSCSAAMKEGKSVAGLAAGGHLDPKKTSKHLGPNALGHIGDMSSLYVDKNGRARDATNVPNISTSDIVGHAFIIHAGGDNYRDNPKVLGGGGARIACGIIKAP